MITYQPPYPYNKDKYTIFLGGSIDMGNCENWQSRIINDLSNEDVILLNPRRDDFDETQVQSIKNEYFRNQVDWELEGLKNSDLIIMYLMPGTYSPISLLEIGLYTDINSIINNKILICCPDGFWRKGNIEIICDKYRIPLYEDYESLIEEIKLRCHHT